MTYIVAVVLLYTQVGDYLNASENILAACNIEAEVSERDRFGAGGDFFLEGHFLSAFSFLLLLLDFMQPSRDPTVSEIAPF